MTEPMFIGAKTCTRKDKKNFQIMRRDAPGIYIPHHKTLWSQEQVTNAVSHLNKVQEELMAWKNFDQNKGAAVEANQPGEKEIL